MLLHSCIPNYIDVLVLGLIMNIYVYIVLNYIPPYHVFPRLLVLNDETLQSAWCQFEIDCARRNKIPVVCICDVDKQLLRSTVDFFMESGHEYLFDEQVITYTTQGREHSHALIIEAIERAVQSASSQQQTALEPEPAAEAETAEAPQPKADRVHDIDDDSQHELMAALWSKFGTAKAAFDSFSNEEGIIGKKELRQMVKRLFQHCQRLQQRL